jgi:hypothetical protein
MRIVSSSDFGLSPACYDSGGALSGERARCRRRILLDNNAKTIAMRYELEQFQEKWKPVFRPELRQNNTLDRIIDSVKR